MRDALGIGKEIDILDYVHSLPPTQEEEAQEKLRVIERRAMIDMVPQPGLNELMDYLKSKDIPKSICTRNFPIPVQHLLDNFLREHHIDPLVTREFKPPKPAPDGILHIAREWNIDPNNIVMVGDSVDDMRAGHAAGTTTVLLQSDVNRHLNEIAETDAVVRRLDDIIELFEKGFNRKERVN
jgi:HAD superfamily hydrolase (TIGR01509 family)